MFTLTVWTSDEPVIFTASTRELVLRALRRWMNGGDYDGGSLTVRDCIGTDDVTLSWDEALGKWHITWDIFAEGHFADWDGAQGAAEAFVGGCACKVADLDARCSCADCKRLMVRAYAPYIPSVGWVCFDCLVEYVGLPYCFPEEEL